MSLFLEGKKIVKKMNYIPVKSSHLSCVVFNNFLFKSQPSNSTKASKSASNDTTSLNQSTMKLEPMSKKRKIHKFQKVELNEFE